jgi:hypothetical protein
MSEKERLKLFVKSTNLSENAFCLRCNLPRTFISSMKNSFGNDKLNKIVEQFPDLNTIWLRMGEGQMLKSQNKCDTCNNEVSDCIINIDYKEKYFEVLERYYNIREENDKLKRIINSTMK